MSRSLSDYPISVNLPVSILRVLSQHHVVLPDGLVLPAEASSVKDNFPLMTLSIPDRLLESPDGDYLRITSTYAPSGSSGADDSGWLVYQTLEWNSGLVVAYFFTQDAVKNTRVSDHICSVLERLDQKQQASMKVASVSDPSAHSTPPSAEEWEGTFRDWVHSAFGEANVFEKPRPRAKRATKLILPREGETLILTVFTDKYEFKIRSVYLRRRRRDTPNVVTKEWDPCHLGCTALQRAFEPGEATRRVISGPDGIFSESLFKEITAWMLKLSLIPPVKSQQSQEEDDDDY